MTSSSDSTDLPRLVEDSHIEGSIRQQRAVDGEAGAGHDGHGGGHAAQSGSGAVRVALTADSVGHNLRDQLEIQTLTRERTSSSGQ